MPKARAHAGSPAESAREKRQPAGSEHIAQERGTCAAAFATATLGRGPAEGLEESTGTASSALNQPAKASRLRSVFRRIRRRCLPTAAAAHRLPRDGPRSRARTVPQAPRNACVSPDRTRYGNAGVAQALDLYEPLPGRFACPRSTSTCAGHTILPLGGLSRFQAAEQCQQRHRSFAAGLTEATSAGTAAICRLQPLQRCREYIAPDG